MPSFEHAGPVFVHVVKSDDTSGNNMGKETGKVRQDILVTVRTVNEQKVDGFVPRFCDLGTEAHDWLNILGQAAAVDVLPKLLEESMFAKIPIVSIKRVYGEDTFFASSAAES